MLWRGALCCVLLCFDVRVVRDCGVMCVVVMLLCVDLCCVVLRFGVLFCIVGCCVSLCCDMFLL